MNEILTVLLIALLFPYLLVPILIRRRQYFSLAPKLRSVTGGFLPKRVEEFFIKSSNDLRVLGFDQRIDAVSLDYGPNIRVFMRLFVCVKNKITAVCTSILPDGSKDPIRNFVEFSSRCRDGREISTHNSDLASAPIEHQQKIAQALYSINNAKLLLDFHHHTIKKLNVMSKELAETPEEGQEITFLVQTQKDDLHRQVSLGCLVLDNENNVYRPTWAGAFLIGWYSMWPISPLRRMLQKITAKIKIKKLEKANA